MSLSKSRGSYGDCFDLYNAALDNDLGVRIRVLSRDQAFHLRMRMHMARTIIRNENKTQYEYGHPMYGATPYDALTVRIRPGEDCWWVHLEKEIIEIDDIEPLAKPMLTKNEIRSIEYEPKPQLLLEHVPTPKVVRRV